MPGTAGYAGTDGWPESDSVGPAPRRDRTRRAEATPRSLAPLYREVSPGHIITMQRCASPQRRFERMPAGATSIAACPGTNTLAVVPAETVTANFKIPSSIRQLRMVLG